MVNSDDKKGPNGGDGNEGAKLEDLKITDAVKKLFSIGVSAAFMTEESLRNHLGDLKLPKEIFSLVLQGASKSKDEITQRVSKEMISMIEKIDFVKEFSKFAETHKFKITAEIDIVKKENPSDKSKEV